MSTTLSRHLKKTVGSNLSLIRNGQFREGSEGGGPTEEREGGTKETGNAVFI